MSDDEMQGYRQQPGKLPFAKPGSLFPPKRSKRIRKIITNSPVPKLNIKNPHKDEAYLLIKKRKIRNKNYFYLLCYQ